MLWLQQLFNDYRTTIELENFMSLRFCTDLVTCSKTPPAVNFDWSAATLAAVGKVAEAEAQEVAKLRMQVAESNTQPDQVCHL